MTLKWHIFATIILIQLKSFHCNTIELSSYSRVAKNGNADADAAHAAAKAVEVHRAREGVINSDLWQPKTGLNDNDADKSTGRALDDNRGFSFPLKDIAFSSTDKATNHRYNAKPNVVYAASPVSQVAQDRFVPRESISYFIQKNSNRVKTSANRPNESDREDDPPLGPGQIPPSTDDGKSSGADSGPAYTPPKNLYSFPPNIGAAYAAPSPDLPSPISVSSYLPPPSGPTNYPGFPGPLNPSFSGGSSLFPAANIPFPGPSPPYPVGNPSPPPPRAQNDQPDARPSSDMDDDNMDGPARPPPNDSPVKLKFNKDPNDFILDPAYADQDDLQDQGQQLQDDPHDHHPHDDPHDHPHHHHHHDHGHDHHPVIFDSPYDDALRHLHGYDAVPEVVFDHPHDHDFFHGHHPIALPPPPPSTPPPPPPPPPEDIPDIEPEEQPRVKKYSYFYLARSLWYIPLYFTVWFTFYVTWLILQSIGRHAAALPNHTVNRRSIMDLTHREAVDKVDVLTEFVMTQIDDFHKKYL